MLPEIVEGSRRVVNRPHWLIKDPHERKPVPHRKIHTNDRPTIGAEVARRWGSPWVNATLTREMADRYPRARRPQKSAMLDEFVELHGCTRHHAGWLLRMWGKTVFERRGGELVKIVVGQRRRRRRTLRLYDEQVVTALKQVWYLFGCLCDKRLVAVLRAQLPLLEKCGELALDH